MDPLIIILFFVGLGEEFVAMLFYKTGAKNFDSMCAFLSLIRGLLWVFVITTLIKHTENNLIVALFYVTGCSIGTYISLKIEPMLEKFCISLQKKGRRFKRWFLKNKRK